jgi:hypothetical protein
MSDLPIKDGDDFVGEFEVMNLDKLKDKTFLVAVNTGERNNGKFLCTTVHGPYDYYDMIEEVGFMWENQQHHAAVIITQKNRNSGLDFLDENSIDYIEANYTELLVEELLEQPKEYTCQANILHEDDETKKEHEENDNES